VRCRRVCCETTLLISVSIVGVIDGGEAACNSKEISSECKHIPSSAAAAPALMQKGRRQVASNTKAIRTLNSSPTSYEHRNL